MASYHNVAPAGAVPASFVGETTKVRGSQVPGLSRNVWGQSELKPTYPKLDRNIEADVCVVGAGIAGLTTAYILARAGERQRGQRVRLQKAAKTYLQRDAL